MSNLYSRLAADFSADLDRVFAWLPDGRALHYADVEIQSARYAHTLRDLGVGIGDRVAVQVEKSAEMLMLYLGCLRAGAIFLPLNPAYTIGELEYLHRRRRAEPVRCRSRGGRKGRRDQKCGRPGQGRDAGRGRRGHARRAGASGAVALRDDREGGRRSRRHPLHIGNDRPLEGSDAEPWQSCIERLYASRSLAVYGRRCAAARSADIPHPRPVRGDQRHPGLRRCDDFPATVRSRGGYGGAAARDGHDGRADILYPFARRGRVSIAIWSRICDCSSRGPRLWHPMCTANSMRVPGMPFSSATA